MALMRPENLWEQIATDIRGRIAEGEYAPGTRLPSEAQMIGAYGVSRPVVRQAIAALRAEGIVTVQHGKGAWVREQAAPTGVLDRRIIRTGSGTKARYTEPGAYTEAEEPTRYRTVTDAETGPMLGLGEGEACFAADRLLIDAESGARVMHRVVVPFATADGTALEQDPHQAPAGIYTALAAAGHVLSWQEQTAARMPTPDEAAALGLGEGVPLLVIRRVTRSADRPLLFEETRAGADAFRAEHRVTANTARGSLHAV